MHNLLAVLWLAHFPFAPADSCRSDDTSLIQLAPSKLQQRATQCLEVYKTAVEEIIPGFGDHVLLRSWGGKSVKQKEKGPKPLDPQAKLPALAVGFDGSTTLALATFCRQRGLSVLHNLPGQTPQWSASYPSLYAKYDHAGKCREELDSFDYSAAISEGYNVLFDEAISHHFLDFFFAAPASKVLLAVHPSTVKGGINGSVQLRSEHSFPALSSCGRAAEDVSETEAIQLMRSHQDLVRCVVPPEQLLEVRLEKNNITRLSEFLGLGLREFESPWPQFRYGFSPRFRGGLDWKEVGKTLSVCITGQIGRLELDSKIAHLVKPANRAGLRVIVMLVIDPRKETHFVHRGGLDIVLGPYMEFRELHGKIPAPTSVIYDSFIPKDYPIVPGYLHALRNEPGNPRLRAFSHMRQWEALRRCAHLQEHLAPDMTMRLREDAYLLRNLHPQHVSKGVFVPSCRPCGGVNDKAAIAIGAEVANKYLTAPLRLMQNNYSLVMQKHKVRSKGPMGPEAVLQESLATVSIEAATLPPEVWPMAPARRIQVKGRYYYCFYRSVQECLPKALLNELKANSPKISGVANESVACTAVEDRKPGF